MPRRKILCISGMITVPVSVPGGASQASHACVPTPRALAGESNCLWFKRFELGCVVSVLNLGALYHDLLCHPHHLLGYCLSCRGWNWEIVRDNRIIALIFNAHVFKYYGALLCCTWYANSNEVSLISSWQESISLKCQVCNEYEIAVSCFGILHHL